MAPKKKSTSGRQKAAKDNNPTNKIVLWQAVIGALVTVLVAYLGYRQVIEVPKMFIAATQTAQILNLSFTQTAFALLPMPTSTATMTPVHTSTSTPTKEFTDTPPSASATVTATKTSTATPQPTATPEPRPLGENCIDPQIWEPASADAAALAGISQYTNGCYSMEALGIFTDSAGTLHLNYRDRRSVAAAGIYTPIRNDSVIEFKVFVNSMYVVYLDKPLTVNFAVAPANDPITEKNTARFNLHVDTNEKPPIVHFVLADVGEHLGTKVGTQHYEYGRTYTIRLELVGNFMKVYINGREMLETPYIPTGQKVFYIGYNIPIISGVDVEVKDITIDGAPR